MSRSPRAARAARVMGTLTVLVLAGGGIVLGLRRRTVRRSH
ncbi:hypothetical protein OG713_21735 [Streptomyces sp. NBC_00723]